MTGVEGYPGLLGHAPLTALLLSDIAAADFELADQVNTGSYTVVRNYLTQDLYFHENSFVNGHWEAAMALTELGRSPATWRR